MRASSTLWHIVQPAGICRGCVVRWVGDLWSHRDDLSAVTGKAAWQHVSLGERTAGQVTGVLTCQCLLQGDAAVHGARAGDQLPVRE